MKKFLRKSRKPLSFLLAFCMFLSAVSVGMTVLAADIADRQTTAGSNIDSYANSLSALNGLSDEQFRSTVQGYINNKNSSALYDMLVELFRDERILDNYDGTSRPDRPGGVAVRVAIEDTWDGLYARCAHLVQAIVRVVGFPTPAGNALSSLNSMMEDNGGVIKTMQSRMGADYQDKFTVLLRRLAGVWDQGSTNIATTDCFTFVTRSAPGKTYLLRYASLEDIPDTVWTQMAATICHERSGMPWNYKWSFQNNAWSAVTYNDEKLDRANYDNKYGGMADGDTTSKAALVAFNALFPHDLLNNPSRLDASIYSKAQLADIYTNGQAVLDAVAGMDDSVLAHFFKQEGDSYTETVRDNAQAIFDAVKTAVDQAIDVFTTNVENAWSVFGTVEADLITEGELEQLNALLLPAKNAYDTLLDSQKTDEKVMAAMPHYNALLELQKAGVTKFYPARYLVLLGEFIDYLRTDTVKNAAWDNPMVEDDAAGNFAKLLETYVLMLQKQIALTAEETQDENILNTTQKFNAKLSKDLLDQLGNDEYTQRNVADLLNLIGCVGDGTDSVKTFTVVSEPLLYTYQNIGEIPKTFSYNQSVYTYIYIDGVLADMTKVTANTTAQWNSVAFTNFRAWANAFRADVMNADLSTWNRDQLIAALADAADAQEQVKDYSAKIKARLLQPTMEQAEARILEMQAAMGDLFVKTANEIKSYYDANLTGTPVEDLPQDFLDMLVDAYQTYAELTEAQLERQDVQDAYNMLNGLLGTDLSAYASYQLYIKSGKQLLATFFEPDGSTLKEITLSLSTEAKLQLSTMGHRYNALAESYKAQEDVVDYKAAYDKLKAEIDAMFANSNWEQVTVDYSAITNATKENVADVISRLDKLLGSETIAAALGGQAGQDLGDVVSDLLYNQVLNADLINTIMQFLYPAVWSAVRQAVIDVAGSFVAGILNDDNLSNGTSLYFTPGQAAGAVDPAFRDVRNAMSSRGNSSWDGVNWANMNWTYYNTDGSTTAIHDADSFIKALTSALGGVWNILACILFDYDITYNIVVKGTAMYGEPGYQKYVGPFLNALGCKEVASYETMKQMNTDMGDRYFPSDGVPVKRENIMRAMLKPVFNWLDGVLDAPASSLLNLLPTLAFIVDDSIEIKNSAGKVIGYKSMLTTAADGLLSAVGMSLSSILGPDSNINLNDLNGMLKSLLGSIQVGTTPNPDGTETPIMVDLNIPDIDFGEISGIADGTTPGYAPSGVFPFTAKLEAKQDELLIYLLRYVVNLVKANPDLIAAFTGSLDESITGLIDAALDKDTDTIINAFWGVLAPKDITDVDWDMSGWNFLKDVDSPFEGTDLNSAKVKQAISQIDAVINVVAKQFLNRNLTDLLGDNLVNDATLSSMTTAIYKVLGSEGLKSIWGMFGIDVSPKAMAVNLKAYPEVAAVLAAAESWDTVDLTDVPWGLNANSGTPLNDQFAIAIARILASMNPVVRLLLAGDDVDFFDGALTIKGADGYSNAILPLMRALGCEATAVTSEEYKALYQQFGDDALLFSIIKPLLDKANELLQNPAGTLAEMLPNFAYFLDNGGLTKAFNALLLPLTNVTDSVMALFAVEDDFGNVTIPTLLDFALSVAGSYIPADVKAIIDQIDLNDLDGSILPLAKNMLANLNINGTQFNIVLPELKWETIAGRGDKKSDGGIWHAVLDWTKDEPSTYHIEADAGASAMAVLNFVFETLQLNQTTILGLLGDTEGNEMMAFVKDLLLDLLANDAKDISSAFVKALILENPADDDWDMSDFVGVVTEKLYGEDLEKARVARAIVKADAMIQTVAGMFLPEGTGSLQAFVSQNLFTDGMAATIFKALYGAMDGAEIGTVMGLLELNATPDGVAAALQGDYPAVASLLSGAATWADVFAKEGWASVSFNVTDSASFSAALAAILRPFQPVIKALMIKGDDFSVAGYKIKSANGYSNSIIPLLGALGCNTAMTAEEYAAAVDTNPDAVITGLLNPLFDLVNRICNSPVSTLSEILPNLAYFMNNDGLTRALKNLLKPLSNIMDELVPLFKDADGNPYKDTYAFATDLVGKFVELPEGIDIEKLLTDLKNQVIPVANLFLKNLNINGTTLSLQLPDLDWGKLAGCGEVKTTDDAPFFAGIAGENSFTKYKYVEADKENTILVALTYLFKTLALNKDTLLGLLGSLPAELLPYIESLLDNDPETLAKAVIKVIETKEIVDSEWDMTDAEDFFWALNTAVYTQDVTAEDVETAIATVDKLLAGLLPSLMDGKSLKEFAHGALYTDANVSMIAGAVYNALNGADLAAVMNTLGFKVSTTDMAAAWASYPNVVAALNGKAEWSEVDLSAASWGVKDAATFAKALADVFSPFNDVLKALLVKGNDYTLLGVYEIRSANGYKDAVLPLLAALGCTDGVLSTEEYAAAVEKDGNAALVNILTPIFNLLDRICDKPVDTLATILPNMAYFLSNKGLTRCLMNLLKPLTNITDEVLPLIKDQNGNPLTLESLVASLLPEGTEIDLENLDAAILPMVQSLLEKGFQVGGQTISIKLPSFTWAALAGHGTLKSNADAPFLGKILGDTKYKYVEANKGDVTMAVLNYVVDTLKANQDVLINLLRENLDASLFDTLLPMIQRLLSNNSEEISCALIRVILHTGSANVDWSDMAWNVAGAFYPAGVTAARSNATAATLDKLIKNALASFTGIRLYQVASTYLYQNDNISMIAGALYGALGSEDVASVLEVLGITATPSAVAAMLEKDYPQVASRMAGKATWGEVNLDGADWKATDRNGFASALAAMLRPFQNVLWFFLAGDGQTMEVADVLPLYGANGYQNAMMPLLLALGCENLPDQATYAANAEQNGDALLTQLITPVLALAEKVINQPVQTLIGILPNFAYFMSNNGLSKALNGLLLPITGIADPILPLLTDEDSLLDFVFTLLGVELPIDLGNLTDSIVPLVNSLLGKLEINGVAMNLQLPEINWANLAGMGKLETVSFSRAKDAGTYNRVVANTADTLMAVLGYITDVIRINGGEIEKLVKGLTDSDIVNEIVSNVVNADSGKLMTMLIDLLAPTGEGLNGSWSYKAIQSVATSYTEKLSKDDFQTAVDTMDEAIFNLLDSFAGITSLNDVVSGALYTNNLMATITSTLFGALDAESLGFDVLGLLKQIGIDMTPSGVAAYTNEGRFNSLKKALNEAKSWSDVDFTKLDWGFRDGDRDGFLKTLAALLRPLSEVLGAVLNGTDLMLLNSVPVKGGKGYNNAIIPLLEALNCEGILTQEQYAAQVTANPDNLILGITTPLFNKIEQLLNSPIKTLTEILPNVAYFLYNDGIGQLVDNLILPVTKVLTAVEPAYKLNLDLSALYNFDIVGTVNGLLKDVEVNDAPLGIYLLPIDWAGLAGRGAVTMYTSARVDANGNPVNATRIVADQPAVLVTVFRYIANVIQDSGNMESITKLLGGLDLGSLSAVVDSLVGMLSSTTTDGLIEFLLNFLLGLGEEDEDYDFDDFPDTDDEWPEDDTEDVTEGGQTVVDNNNNDGENQQDPGKKANLPLIIGLSVGGVALIALAVWFILAKKKKQTAALNSAVTATEETTQTKEEAVTTDTKEK